MVQSYVLKSEFREFSEDTEHNVTKCVNHLQNRESAIVLVANQFKLATHSIDGSIGYVEPIQESKKKQQAEDGNNPEINLPDQR